MTKSEAAAAQARCDAIEFPLPVTNELRAALADREALIEALRPFAEIGARIQDNTGVIPARYLYGAYNLLRSLGELE